MFMEMSTLFLKKIKKFLSLFLWLFALGNDRINEVVFQKEKSGMEGIVLDKTAECKLVLDTAVLAGKIMLQSGALPCHARLSAEKSEERKARRGFSGAHAVGSSRVIIFSITVVAVAGRNFSRQHLCQGF